MATAGEKLVGAVFDKPRPYFPGNNLNQAARWLVANNKYAFRGMTAGDAKKQVIAALQTKLDSGELIRCRDGHGSQRTRGYRRPTHAEKERVVTRTTRMTTQRRPPAHMLRRYRRAGIAAKRGFTYA